MTYSLSNLLVQDKDLIAPYLNGHFMTIYLAPRDYHRVHMPVDGELISMTWVPGRLFSVQPLVTENVNAVFARNERVICLFNTIMGRVAVIFVGAMVVGSVVTSWHGEVRPKESEVTHWDYSGQGYCYKKGEEVGFFQLGSTVIILTQKDQIEALEVIAGDPLLLGQSIATMQTN